MAAARAKPEKPLDPDLVRFVRALAVASARRDHRMAIAAAAPADKAKAG